MPNIDSPRLAGTLTGQLLAAHITAQVLSAMPGGDPQPGARLSRLDGWERLLQAVSQLASEDGATVIYSVQGTDRQGAPTAACGHVLPGSENASSGPITCDRQQGHVGQFHSATNPRTIWMEP